MLAHSLILLLDLLDIPFPPLPGLSQVTLILVVSLLLSRVEGGRTLILVSAPCSTGGGGAHDHGKCTNRIELVDVGL